MPGRDEPSFWGDLRRSAVVWLRRPWLPAISVALASGGFASGGVLWPVSLIVLLMTTGWVGTERIIYLRAFRGLPVRRRELVRMTLAFVPRYALLGGLFALLMLPATIALSAFRSPAGEDPNLSGFFWYVGAVGFTIGVALTFVTPALAFTTRRIREALSIGFRMISTEWPTAAPYVVVPPTLSFAILLLAAPWNDRALFTSIAITMGSTLLNLWFKGATAAFYLRRMSVGDDGAAFLHRPLPANPDVPT
jgi:hypothetical protein